MATKLAYKTTFEVDQVIRPIYTGGSVALDNGSRILATTLGEDAVLTDLATGKQFARIEGVRIPGVVQLQLAWEKTQRTTANIGFRTASQSRH